jgi:hypothetical protein
MTKRGGGIDPIKVDFVRNVRLVNIITYIVEESKLISENMSPNVIHC